MKYSVYGIFSAVLFCMSCSIDNGHGPLRPTAWQPAPPPTSSSSTQTIADTPVTASPAPQALASLDVRIQLATGLSSITFANSGATHVTGADQRVHAIKPAVWTCMPQKLQPAREQYHVFPKTFTPRESHEAQAYMTQWASRGYRPKPITLGRTYPAVDGTTLDNRVVWISLATFDTEKEANGLVKKLESESVWAWVRSERVAPGAGAATLNASANAPADVRLPATIQSDAPIEFERLPGGKTRHTTGTVEIGVGPDGKLELYETLPIEDYLKGVLPGEMPASWPQEALAAQAVAARSVSLATSSTKHGLDGFWACSSVHCKVYNGAEARTPATDRAVDDSAGEVMIHAGSIVPAVFCANCGGWTEDNDTVWSSPPNPLLRAREDAGAASSVAPNGPVAYGLERWLSAAPKAYCSLDTRNFRWRRTFTGPELSETVNRHHKVGQIRDIVLGDRGPGGRLKWVRIEGSQGTVTIRKELPIRQAFGNLPSALFIIRRGKQEGGSGTFTLVGAGNGHGVGMCQHGARGMALAGSDHRAILRHYFSSMDLGRLR